MQNQKKEQDSKLLNLVPNLLTGLKSVDANRYHEIAKFLKTAFLELSDHELFDDPSYRRQWADNICVIEALSFPFEGYSNQEKTMAIDISLLVLSQSRKEVSHG
ncbi:hypothetical protein LIT63_06840 [Flavobacterium psychrophilum]|uniref:hypothetical protein n=1 Tax=Flavobacterium psychrophilum TaxID=96345 RepID=UPI001D078F2B|nr:hypothetical protein [Flavobacterium psychrophilum]MCB5999313.1 hypothetical protein [Flavobacterium psychrophilum]MCB6014252.1 hypothetical protein [Flavobacterium psychrophilum]MCB6021845.1 hypothetical protein [Flavobacterium psychrophilum]MCB6031376.1 hypothetical protein [Flavobacterium psychrophilum]MCB6036738.1 hypothetical protein [Flavobacterium psychrophilum]